MINVLTQKWCTFYHGCFAVWIEVSHNNLGVCVFRYFSPITNTCTYSGLDPSFAKKLVTLQELSWRGVALRKVPSQKWKTVGSTTIYIHTDTSGDEEVIPWNCTDINFLESGPDSSLERKGKKWKRKPGRIVFCSHLPWGKFRANSMIQMELVQISTGLNENIVFIY